MGKKRRGQPGYVAGVDALGRRSWRKVPVAAPATQPGAVTAMAADIANEAGRYVKGHFVPVAGVDPPASTPIDFTGADLSGLDLFGLDLRSCVFTGANLAGANLDGALLGGATFEDANLAGATLRDARMSDGSLSGANLTEADLSHARFDNVTAYGAVFDEANLTAAIVTNSTMSDASFRGVHGNVTLENVVVFRADFTDADVRHGYWDSVHAQDTVLTGANFTDTRFRNVNVTDSNFTGVQATQIIGRGLTYNTLALTLRYGQLTFDEAAGRLGLDPEEFRVLMWLGEIEVRDSYTGGAVTKEFDPARHHIPVWALHHEPDRAAPAQLPA